MADRPGREVTAGPFDAFNPIQGIGTRITTAVQLLHAARASDAREPLLGDLSAIANYHDLLDGPDQAPALSPRACTDLDLDLVFRRVDTCASAVGQQVLYGFLHRPLDRADEIGARGALVEALSTQAEVRERISAAVGELRGQGAYSLPFLFLGPAPDRPRWWPLVPLLSFASVAAILGSFMTPFAWLALAVIAVVNMGVQASFRPTLERFVAPMAALPGLMNAAQRLGAMQHPTLRAHVAALGMARRRLGHLDRYARRFVQELHGNELKDTLVGYANLLFFLDLNAFLFGIARVRRNREDLKALFESIGRLDAACSVARFRESLPAWCTPTFGPTGKRIDVHGLYHPLLTSPVANDLHLDHQDLVVTGSNMAGKTTYLRAAGVAAVLAQSIATVPAVSWNAPVLHVGTLITRNDDLASGKSYFLVEAGIVSDLLRSATLPGQHLFIMDEIFRGTNTRERLAASAAVLRYLSRGDNICLVATHDVELEHLLDANWAFWHFRESVGESGVDFDYRVHPGVSSAPNALHMLEASGYPRELLEDAFALYERMGHPDGREE